jgi:energy-coupling factor transport system permease protein
MHWLLVQLRWLLLTILLIFPWLAAEPGPTLLQVGPVTMTTADIELTVATVLRIWGMSLLITALLFTTTQHALVRGLVRLGLPYQWGLTLAIALRYIPSFAYQIEQIQEAQAARGWDASRGDIVKRLRNFSPVLIALTIHVFRTVDTLTLAMTARGVSRATPRTERNPLRLTRPDYLTLLLTMTASIALIVWKLRNP